MALNLRLILILSLPAVYAVVVVGFNAFWHQPSPQASLIRLAELELDTRGISHCPNPEEYQVGSLLPNQHNCRWWRIPYEKGLYCGRLNELIKPSQNCFEIIFEDGTPEIVLSYFREVFQNPCTILPGYSQNLHYQSMYRDLRCETGSDYRHFTTYLLVVESFKDDGTKRLVHDFGDILSVEKIRRTRICQFI